MDQDHLIIFVCEHGAAKSIIAAAYFNQLAKQTGVELKAVARGTNPEHELSRSTIHGLAKDGLVPTESTPQQLSLDDMRSAQQIVSFCDLPIEYQQMRRDGQPPILTTEQWDDVLPVSESYDQARDAIIAHINVLVDKIRSSS